MGSVKNDQGVSWIHSRHMRNWSTVWVHEICHEHTDGTRTIDGLC